jgi:DNA-binding transcriptional MerR regulator
MDMAPMVRLNVDMKSTSDALTIGEIAGRFGLPAHVLRHWESVGLLAPARAEGRRRRYGTDDLYRVAVILRAKEAGFGLEDIRQMIATPDVVARRDILRCKGAELARRIAEAQTSLDLIECALECDHDDFTQCDDFRAMVAARIGVESPPHDQVCPQYS